MSDDRFPKQESLDTASPNNAYPKLIRVKFNKNDTDSCFQNEAVNAEIVPHRTINTRRHAHGDGFAVHA